MKIKSILIKLEFKWRAFRVLRKILNSMICHGMSYNCSGVCFVNQRLNNCLADLIEIEKYYENETGIKIEYYKKHEI